MSSVIVSAYSTEWPNLFCAVRAELLPVFAPTVVEVEHIGSTSVPGLVAKPVIDVLLGAHSLLDIESKISLLNELGYQYVSKYERELPMRRYFVKSSATSLRIHLHAVQLDSKLWQNHLTFRDALRTDANLRARYQSLKLHLAQVFGDDKSAYTAAKDPFIQSVLTAAIQSEHVGQSLSG
jgi:GrpB-like predicted nucleotidyltransferase (UPF0157 family)